jgi:hypothetical protein
MPRPFSHPELCGLSRTSTDVVSLREVAAHGNWKDERGLRARGLRGKAGGWTDNPSWAP